MSAKGISLAVRNLRKSWGVTDVLKGIDFDIHAVEPFGEIAAA